MGIFTALTGTLVNVGTVLLGSVVGLCLGKGLPDRIGTEPFDVTIIDHDGNASVHPMRPHRCSKTNDVSQFYVNFEKPLVELGAQTMGKFGNADVRIVDAKKCREIVGRIYRRASEDIFCEFREIPQELYR